MRCAFSGLPIKYGHEIVAFKLEPYKFKDDTNFLYIPASWPIFGTYNDYGGIEGFDLTEEDNAFIHIDVWNNAHCFWHYGNRPIDTNWLDYQPLLEDAKREYQEMGNYNVELKDGLRKSFELEDYFFIRLNRMCQNSDMGLVFRNFNDGVNVTKWKDNYCFLYRTTFLEIIVRKIVREQWTEKYQNILNKLICLYGGQGIIGKQITPSTYLYVEQCADYKQRINALKFQLTLAEKLQHNIDSNNKKYEYE